MITILLNDHPAATRSETCSFDRGKGLNPKLRYKKNLKLNNSNFFELLQKNLKCVINLIDIKRFFFRVSKKATLFSKHSLSERSLMANTITNLAFISI